MRFSAYLLVLGLTLPVLASGALASGKLATGAQASGERASGAPVRARFVRVESGASRDYLHFAELEVYVGGQNIAVHKKVTASSYMPPFAPERAVDGIVEYVWGPEASFWHSAGKGGNEWWELDLGQEVPVEQLILYNRLDAAPERLAGAVLRLLGENREDRFRQTLTAEANPIFLEFVKSSVRRRKPVLDFSQQSMAARRAELSPRFTSPAEDTGYVMPVGSGDLSAMLRYGSAWEIHLSKTDFFKPGNILSPGHVQLSFGVSNEALTQFEQRLDLNRGSVVLTLKTAQGQIIAEAYGIRGHNALLIAVQDTRPTPEVQATFSLWRPGISIVREENLLITREVHQCNEQGKIVADPAQVPPEDRVFRLGAGLVLGFVDARGRVPADGTEHKTERGIIATLKPASVGHKYWLIITCATSYDGQPQEMARKTFLRLSRANQDQLRHTQRAFWDRFWEKSFLDLRGRDADKLTQLWHVTLYSYASVGEGPVLPKFNGGPGLVVEDDRHWGWRYWWQNTREIIWPMFAANHLEYARAHLDFYDRLYMDFKQETARLGKLGLRVWELANPLKPGLSPPPKEVSRFSAAALEAALRDQRMESVPSGYNARSLAQGAELVQQMFDYVAYTGDKSFLYEVVAPWLKEVTLFYLSYLKREDDGLYHMTPSDALEIWWQVKDPLTDMCAVRYCFWQTLKYGAEFGYEPAFLAAVRERLAHLAPLPTGRFIRRPARAEEIPPGRPSYIQAGTPLVERIEPDDTLYAPAAAFLADRLAYNVEQPELYVIFPFALADSQSPAPDYQRAVKTFRARQHSNVCGWSQDGIQAARLRLPETVEVIMDHVRRHQRYPYGGWISPSVPLRGSKLSLTDAPYFDSAGVNMTALQETLLQSHRLTTPAPEDPFSGGPIRLLPAVRPDWAGRFKLRARGGFLVYVEFQPGRRLTRLRIFSERGQTLKLENPFQECQIWRGGKCIASSKEAVVTIATKPQETLEFRGEAPRS